jgi:hypothetical protein
MKRCSKHSNCFLREGKWLYKLLDPFRYIPYIPLDSKDISDCLKISRRTAQRICCGDKELSHAELLALQFNYFGYIPDAMFKRAGFYIKNGSLFCHQAPNYELGAGEILEFSLLSAYYKNAALELAETKKRLAELENPKQPEEPSNIILFADYARK